MQQLDAGEGCGRFKLREQIFALAGGHAYVVAPLHQVGGELLGREGGCG